MAFYGACRNTPNLRLVTMSIGKRNPKTRPQVVFEIRFVQGNQSLSVTTQQSQQCSMSFATKKLGGVCRGPEMSPTSENFKIICIPLNSFKLTVPCFADIFVLTHMPLTTANHCFCYPGREFESLEITKP